MTKKKLIFVNHGSKNQWNGNQSIVFVGNSMKYTAKEISEVYLSKLQKNYLSFKNYKFSKKRSLRQSLKIKT